jgi:outer membrane protein OmpA-like peptidoglycan-associated protein
MTRLFLVLGLLALAVPASAQGRYGDDYYGDPYGRPASTDPGVRIGVGVGAYVYQGPDLLYGDAAFQDDVVATNLAVTAEVSFPLGAEQLRGRILGGLLNIGADDSRADAPGGTNPFLTSETILAEADLMYYLVAPGRSVVAPYLFTGLAGLFATGDASPGVSRSAFAIPVGVGLEVAVSRNLSLYGEASYRFGLNGVGNEVAAAGAAASAAFRGDPCEPGHVKPECKPCDDPATTNPACKPCDDPDTTDPDCDEVEGDNDGDFDDQFNSALFTGGLRLGFNPAPRAYIPPPLPPIAPPPPAIVPPAPPAVCDLVELNAVYFDYGSSTVSQRARALLDENVELLLANPECCVFIDGTIDNAEMDRFGMPLSGRRAQAVYDYYLGRGISASKLQIRNRGEASPDCDKEDPGMGCERNRRVESLPVDCERFLYLLENPSSNPY